MRLLFRNRLKHGDIYDVGDVRVVILWQRAYYAASDGNFYLLERLPGTASELPLRGLLMHLAELAEKVQDGLDELSIGKEVQEEVPITQDEQTQTL